MGRPGGVAAVGGEDEGGRGGGEDLYVVEWVGDAVDDAGGRDVR